MKNPVKKQGGSVLVLTALGLTLFLGIAALAIDLSHLYTNKTRLQNAVDAAALAGAKVLNEELRVLKNPTASQANDAKTKAESAARTVFTQNLTAITQLGFSSTENIADQFSVQFSDTLFDAGQNDYPLYIRVNANEAAMAGWFSVIWGMTSKNTGASAVAGVTPNLNCMDNLVPIFLCAQGKQDENAKGKSHETNEPGTWGYSFNKEIILNEKQWKNEDDDENDLSGVFGYFELDNCNDADCMREQLAKGSGYSCQSGSTQIEIGSTINAITGDMAGAIDTGINTRFGIYPQGKGVLDSSNSAYPSDVNVDCFKSVSSAHENYQINTPEIGKSVCADLKDKPEISSPSVSGRRELIIPVVDCDDIENKENDHHGHGSTKRQVEILDLACLFLHVPAETDKAKDLCQTGDNKGTHEVCAIMVDQCNARGMSGNEKINTSFELKTIQLYKDPLSNDS